MIKQTAFCILGLMIYNIGFGNESFFVLAPDRTNEQLLSLSVNSTEEGISIDQHQALNMPFAPAGITLHPNGKLAIVTGGGTHSTPVASVEILEGGKLRLISTSNLGHPSGYSSVDRSGSYFMMANYPTGKISVHRIEKDGTVGAEVDALRTPKKEAHCILTTPNNRFVYIPCVKNNNALYQYAFDAETGQLTPLDPFNASPPAMFGPRHVAYHPTLPIAYFSNEQQLGVSAYTIAKDGQLSDLQHATTMPRRSPFEQGKRDLHASDIALTPNGKFLFVAVRDFNGDEDSVFTFRMETDGKLSHIGRTKVGDIPWKIDLSPSGNYLIVRESGDKQLSIFKIGSDGVLLSAGSVDLPTGTNDFSVASSN